MKNPMTGPERSEDPSNPPTTRPTGHESRLKVVGGPGQRLLPPARTPNTPLEPPLLSRGSWHRVELVFDPGVGGGKGLYTTPSTVRALTYSTDPH